MPAPPARRQRRRRRRGRNRHRRSRLPRLLVLVLVPRLPPSLVSWPFRVGNSSSQTLFSLHLSPLPPRYSRLTHNTMRARAPYRLGSSSLVLAVILLLSAIGRWVVVECRDARSHTLLTLTRPARPVPSPGATTCPAPIPSSTPQDPRSTSKSTRSCRRTPRCRSTTTRCRSACRPTASTSRAARSILAPSCWASGSRTRRTSSR